MFCYVRWHKWYVCSYTFLLNMNSTIDSPTQDGRRSVSSIEISNSYSASLLQTCTMQTSLPDLPFMNHGDLNLEQTHITLSSAPRASPRTDLQTLRAWESFPDDIHRAIRSATDSAHLSSTPFHIGAYTGGFQHTHYQVLITCIPKYISSTKSIHL